MYWVLTAVLGTLLLYVAVFAPIFLSKTKYKKYAFVITAVAMFVLTVVLLLNILLIVNYNVLVAIQLTVIGYALLLIIALLCTINANNWLKASIATSTILLWYPLCYLVYKILNGQIDNYFTVNFNDWATYTNGNVQLVIVLTGVAIAVTFGLISLFTTKKPAIAIFSYCLTQI